LTDGDGPCGQSLRHYIQQTDQAERPTAAPRQGRSDWTRRTYWRVGPQGPVGPAGPSNLSGLTTVTGSTVGAPPGKVTGAEAVCPFGSHAVSGGGFGSIAGIAASEMETTHQSWFIIVSNETGITLQIHASVQCAGAGQAVAATVPHPTHARLNQLIAELTSDIQKAKHR